MDTQISASHPWRWLKENRIFKALEFSQELGGDGSV